MEKGQEGKGITNSVTKSVIIIVRQSNVSWLTRRVNNVPEHF